MLDEADRTAAEIGGAHRADPGMEKMTPAGSLRRGRETVGDLDVLITGPCCVDDDRARRAHRAHFAVPRHRRCAGASGENKVSFKLRSGMQVDVRHPSAGFLRRRLAILHWIEGAQRGPASARAKAGITLNEYGLFQLEGNERVASTTEEEIYGKLGLDWIPPEMRENCGEIERPPKARITAARRLKDIRGEVHMHTVETDGSCTIEEMAAAAKRTRLPVHRHHRSLQKPGVRQRARREADRRTHRSGIRRASEQIEGITILAGIEVDILADGELDLSTTPPWRRWMW